MGRVAARPSDASRDMIRAVVDADKGDKDAAAGGWRPARGKRGERRRERDAGRARRRERRRSKTEDEIEKNDSDEPVLGQTSRESREDKLRIADRTRTRAFTPGSKLETRASRPPRPAASALSARAFSSAATEKKKPPVGTHDSAIPDDAQKRTDKKSRVDSVESLGSLSGKNKLAASGASASSFGSWADSDDDDELFHETPFPDARAPSSSAPPPAVWGAKRDWGAILAPAGAAMHAKLMSPDRKKKTPGETAARVVLDHFLTRRLRLYESRNDPAKPQSLSGLSPYLHFGQLSAQRCALEASKHRETHPDAVDSFLEELVVRRELADNFCLHNPHYDSVLGAPGWARESLALHATDAREFEYTLAEMERSETHDELWNAAQKELAHLGTMHGFMRMYWAKKILEWTGEGPEEALRRAIYLNDRYQLDGRDPNGYVGCMWAVCGVHDQGWKERDVFGKVRYMNYAGCKRKFKIAEYVQRVEREVAGELAAREARAARRESREGSIA